MRSICEEPTVEAIVDFALQKWKRLDDGWQAMKWALARDPDSGAVITGRLRGRTLPGAKSIGLPTITVVYEFDERTVTIIDVEFNDA
jgi:hypothetical protein